MDNHYQFKPSDFVNVAQATGFCWRWKHLDGQHLRLLTIEPSETSNQNSNTITAAHLFGLKPHLAQMVFQVQSLQVNNGSTYNALALVGCENSEGNLNYPTEQVVPQQLYWTAETGENCSNYHFDVYQMGEHLLVVLVDNNWAINPQGTSPISFFQHIPSAKDEVANAGFCWRWWKYHIDGVEQFHRVLTIEGSFLNDMESVGIYPSNLLMKDPFHEHNLVFGWQSLMMNAGYHFKVVTLEEGQSNPLSYVQLRPLNLKWTQQTEEDCSKYSFGIAEIVAGETIKVVVLLDK